jgi:hypothetical protein
MAVRFMNDRFLNEISPIIKDKLAWDAFLAILAYEESRTIAKLNGPKDIDELYRINAVYSFIQQLKKFRENALYASESSKS